MDWLFENVIARIQAYFGSVWSGLWTPIVDGWPLYHAYWVFFLIFMGCLVAAWVLRTFLPSEWAKIPVLLLGLTAGIALAFTLGQRQMYILMLAKLEKARKKR